MKNVHENCSVYKFNPENLKKVLKNDFISLEDIESKKRHYTYLLDYLGGDDLNGDSGLDSGMILVENKYTSRSYLEDYRDHYFMSYGSYNRECERIHFFKHKISDDVCGDINKKKEFFELLLSNKKDSDEIWEGYLGYIVKRPIPNGIIGVTLLKTYPNKCTNKNYERKYTVRKNYKVNLFGREKIIKTLIYVEQDRIVGACATAALYVAFHRLSHLFDSPKPNQKKISNAAGISHRTPNRKLKNKEGLTPFQICKVIEHYGLDPEIYSLNNQTLDEIKALLYAHLKMGIPIILGFNFNNKEDDDGLPSNDEYHAVTLTGYAEIADKDIDFVSYKDNLLVKSIKSISSKKRKLPLILKSKNIEQFYAHDDQIGPFAKLKLDSQSNQIITSWWDSKKGVTSKLSANPFVSIIPISDRIRLPYEAAYENVEIINIWLHSMIVDLDEISWDIYLSRSNKEKKSILNSDDYNYELHSSALSESFPKYVWVADCHWSGTKLFKVILDASDINHKHFGWDIIYFNEDFKKSILSYFNEEFNQEAVNNKEPFVLDLIKTTGIETTNLFRKSLKLEPFSV